MTPIRGRAQKTLLVGATVAGTILACAPMATADPDDPETSSSPTPSPTAQPPGRPNMPKPNNPNNGEPRTGDLADKNCWVINGVPTWNAPGTAPRPIGPGDTAVPCYYVYGLQPH